MSRIISGSASAIFHVIKTTRQERALVIAPTDRDWDKLQCGRIALSAVQHALGARILGEIRMCHVMAAGRQMPAQVHLKRMSSIIMNQNLHDKRPH